MVSNNRFFQNNTPPSDPGDIDPEDRSFLNYARNARNSTIPNIPDTSSEMANQLGDVYTPPPIPITPELPPNTRISTDPMVQRMYGDQGLEYAPEFDTFQVSKDAQLQSSTFQEIQNSKQIFKQVNNIIQTEKPNLPFDKFTELTDISDRYLSQSKGYNSIDPYEAGTLAMDEVFIAMGRNKPERVRDVNANVLWKETWQKTLSQNKYNTDTFGSFGGELAFNDFKRVEGIKNAPRAVFETIFLTTGIRATGGIVRSVLAKSPVQRLKGVKTAWQNRGSWGSPGSKWLSYNNIGRMINFEIAEERYLIPYSTGLVQQGYRKAGLFSPEEEKLFEEAMIAHRANFPDNVFGNIMQTALLPYMVNTTNLHSTQKQFLEETITGTRFLGIDIEPGEVLGFLIGTGLIGIPFELAQQAIKRKVKGLKDLANNPKFTPNGRVSELPDGIKRRYLEEELPKYVQKVENTYGQKGVLDIPNQLSNVHKSDTRIINTPKDTYANITDPQMPQNKIIIDDINRVYDDLPEMTPVQRLQYLNNPIIRQETNWQNSINWNTHQNAKNQIIDTSHKLIKPLKETRTEFTHKVAINEDPMGKISQEHLAGFGRTEDIKARANGAQFLNALGYQTASDSGLKGGEGYKLELNNIRSDNFEKEIGDINDRTFHSYEEPETDYQMMTSPMISNSFDALEAMRIKLGVGGVDDGISVAFDKTFKSNSLYNSWLQEYQNIIKQKIKSGDIAKTDPKITFDAALRQNGLYDDVNPKNTKNIKFSEIYDLIRSNMVSYEVRINDSAFFKEDGTVLVKHRFSKPKYINGKANYYSKSAWIQETDDGLYDVYDISKLDDVNKISTEQTPEDAREYADQYFTNIIPNISTGELTSKTGDRLMRSKTYNQYNTLGIEEVPNDEKILNLVSNHENMGLYQTISDLIGKHPNEKFDDILKIDHRKNYTERYAINKKGFEQRHPEDAAKLKSEMIKHDFLKGRSNELELHFQGFDADGLGWARIKTVNQADGTKAMSVSEIQSWKSSRVSESDRVPANKIKEWNMFLEMTNTHKKLQAKNITEILRSPPKREASEDLRIGQEIIEAGNYKDTVMWKHAVDNGFWKSTVDDDSVSNFGKKYEPLSNLRKITKKARIQNIQTYLVQNKITYDAENVRSLKNFRTLLSKLKIKTDLRNKIELGQLPNIELPWQNGYLKVAPDAPRLTQKGFNQMMAKMIMEYARNNNLTRILFDDSVSAVGSSIGLRKLDIEYIHRGDINALLYTKRTTIPDEPYKVDADPENLLAVPGVNKYQIIPIGLNKNNGFKTISTNDFAKISELHFSRNNIKSGKLEFEQNAEINKLMYKHGFNGRSYGDFPAGRQYYDTNNEPISDWLNWTTTRGPLVEQYDRNVPELTLDQVKKLFGGNIADAIKTDQMVVSNGNETSLLHSSINFSKFPPNTDLGATSNVRKNFEGSQQQHYSKIMYKTNFSSEATNSNSYVEVTKNSVPYFLKKQFDDLNYKGGLYEGVKTELVTTKYDVSPKTPQIFRTDDPLGDPRDFGGDGLVQRTLHNDEDILNIFKTYRSEALEDYDQGNYVEVMTDLIDEMEKGLKQLYKEFPERNSKLSKLTPNQEQYTKAFVKVRKKYQLSDESVQEMMDDVGYRLSDEEGQLQYEQEQYQANQDRFESEDDPFADDLDFEPQEFTEKFIYAYEPHKTLDGITLEIDGKPLTMLDIQNITDFEVFRKTASGKKASTQFFNDGKIVVNSFKNANISDMFHEIGHLTIPKLKTFLDPDEYSNVLNYYGVKDGKWTRKNHEKFADDFMSYLDDPNSGFWKDASKSNIRRGFEYIISFFKRLFGSTIKENTGLSPEVKKMVYALYKKTPDEGFSKFEKEFDFPIDPQSRQIINRIEESHARKIAKIEKVENKLKERLSPESDGSGKKPGEPYVEEYEDGDDSYKILYNHFLPSHEETRTVGLMRQVEGARNAIISKNEQWVKETQNAVYNKYKIKPDNLTTNFDAYGDPNDTLDLYAALHGERLVTDPKLITANMQIVNVGNRQYGIRTPLSPSEARDSLKEPWKRDMYNRVTVLRLEEEIEMLDFLEDTFRAVDDNTWDTVRLGFNAEIFFEKMMGIPNYFPRLWQDKAGAKIVSGRRVAGPAPRFTKGRVNRTFIEMLIDNPDESYEGLLPSTADPSVMMASRKIYGSSWRELQVMMNTLNKFGLMKSRNDLLDQGLDPKEISKQWEVPKIGPTFEGMLVPSGKADVAFTPEIYVPRNVSTFLNNMFDADPPVAGLGMADKINMFGKQIKVALAPLQHIDMYYRGLGSSTTGAVFETFVPSNLTNPKRIAQGVYQGITTPVSLASDILLSNLPYTGKIWRNKLAKQISSDNVVNPVLKGPASKVTFRMLEEQGAGVKGDRGIISGVNRNIEEFKKANPSVMDKFGPKRLKDELANLNKFFQDGLFEGTYRYAQMGAIKNYVLPYSARVNKDFTPQQHAAWAATYSNTQFSTLGLFQEWIKGANFQKAFNLAIFSRIENQALINQGIETLGIRFLRPEPGAKGLKKIPIKMSKKRAAFFAKNFLGFYITFWVLGNLQNSGAEIFKNGMPKDSDDYVNNYLMKKDQLEPMQKSINEDSLFPYTYNSKFMAPNIGYFGRNNQAVYFDQVGQMDTIFRWMNPIDALWGRTGVPIQTIRRQVTKETFFGQPFENNGMALTQFIADTSLPWMAQNGLNVTAQAYPKTQKFIPTSEKRLGVKGSAGQFIVNLRAINNEQLKQMALDKYQKKYVDSADTFLGVFPNKWDLTSRKQKDEILNKFPNIKAELDLRKFESDAYERIQALPEIEKGVALSEYTARMENDRLSKQIGVINQFVNNLGRFGSDAFFTAQINRGSDIEYRKLELFSDSLKDIDNKFYAGKEAVNIFLKLDDYEPSVSDENTQAMTEYYENMKKFTSEESDIFMIEDWLEFRDNKFYPSLTEGQRTYIQNNFAPSNVPYLDEYEDWIAEGYDLNIPRDYSEVQAFWQDKLKELLEVRDELPANKYID